MIIKIRGINKKVKDGILRWILNFVLYGIVIMVLVIRCRSLVIIGNWGKWWKNVGKVERKL